MKDKIEWFLSSNDMLARLLRTILEAVLGVFIANIDMFFDGLTLQPEVKTLIVGIVVAIVSPILASLREKQDKSRTNEEENAEK